MAWLSENEWIGLPDQELAGWLIEGQRKLTRAEATWLGALAAFDRRAGYRSLGYRSCASWLARTTGMLLVTAREKVRMARELTTRLTQVGDALARGSISGEFELEAEDGEFFTAAIDSVLGAGRGQPDPADARPASGRCADDARARRGRSSRAAPPRPGPHRVLVARRLSVVHRLTHEGGWSARGNADHELEFTSPVGLQYRSSPPALRHAG